MKDFTLNYNNTEYNVLFEKEASYSYKCIITAKAAEFSGIVAIGNGNGVTSLMASNRAFESAIKYFSNNKKETFRNKYYDNN